MTFQNDVKKAVSRFSNFFANFTASALVSLFCKLSLPSVFSTDIYVCHSDSTNCKVHPHVPTTSCHLNALEDMHDECYLLMHFVGYVFLYFLLHFSEQPTYEWILTK